MKCHVSGLISKIHEAVESDSGFEYLKQFIFDYYYAEDDYIFESDGMEYLFDVLSVYLESEEAYGDPLREVRLKRLRRVIQDRYGTIEDMIAALKYDEIGNLLDKSESGAISQALFYSQICNLSPLSFDAEKLVAAYRRRLSDPEERDMSPSEMEIPICFPREIAEQIRKMPDMDAFVSAVVKEALENRSEGAQL
ncbi:hypothetical protein QUF72_17225 [Desulfobacterales bacterium HSG2]|nr:hypothetical protein [Desulfobacterales bacterium HSG2]